MPGIGEWIKKATSGATGGVFTGVADLISRFVVDPTKKAEALKELEIKKMSHDEEMAKIAIQADEIAAKELETVNATMREESKSEHFIVYSWRPLVGYCFILMLVSNYVILPYFQKYGMKSVDIPSEVTYTMMTILGVASAGRAVQKWQAEKNNS